MPKAVEQMAISKFKAECLAVLERVRRTRRPILITRFGKPVAQVVPPGPPQAARDWLGALSGSLEIVGDIVGPAADPEDWEALAP